MADHQLPSPELLRKLLDYDPDTGVLMWKERPREMFTRDRIWRAWNAQWASKPAFTAISDGYRCGAILNKRHQAHRVIWAIMTGRWPENDIDHHNGTRHDNRWANLREVGRAINNRNARMLDRNTSGVNGVYWDRKCRKWKAQMGVNRKVISLGRFENIEDAIAARKAAEAGHGFTERHGTHS